MFNYSLLLDGHDVCKRYNSWNVSSEFILVLKTADFHGTLLYTVIPRCEIMIMLLYTFVRKVLLLRLLSLHGGSLAGKTEIVGSLANAHRIFLATIYFHSLPQVYWKLESSSSLSFLQGWLFSISRFMAIVPRLLCWKLLKESNRRMY